MFSISFALLNLAILNGLNTFSCSLSTNNVPAPQQQTSRYNATTPAFTGFTQHNIAAAQQQQPTFISASQPTSFVAYQQVTYFFVNKLKK